jgi:hypothetical protein
VEVDSPRGLVAPEGGCASTRWGGHHLGTTGSVLGPAPGDQEGATGRSVARPDVNRGGRCTRVSEVTRPTQRDVSAVTWPVRVGGIASGRMSPSGAVSGQVRAGPVPLRGKRDAATATSDAREGGRGRRVGRTGRSDAPRPPTDGRAWLARAARTDRPRGRTGRRVAPVAARHDRTRTGHSRSARSAHDAPVGPATGARGVVASTSRRPPRSASSRPPPAANVASSLAVLGLDDGSERCASASSPAAATSPA